MKVVSARTAPSEKTSFSSKLKPFTISISQATMAKYQVSITDFAGFNSIQAAFDTMEEAKQFANELADQFGDMGVYIDSENKYGIHIKTLQEPLTEKDRGNVCMECQFSDYLKQIRKN